MKTKQEVIQAAWGKEWDKVKTHIDEWGRLTYQQCYDIWGDGIHSENNFYFEMRSNNFPILFNDTEDGYYYPKVLEGIQTNNGWIRIESEEDLPKGEMFYTVFTVFENGKQNTAEWWSGDPERIQHWKDRGITHYRPIVQYAPPIY